MGILTYVGPWPVEWDGWSGDVWVDGENASEALEWYAYSEGEAIEVAKAYVSYFLAYRR